MFGHLELAGFSAFVAAAAAVAGLAFTVIKDMRGRQEADRRRAHQALKQAETRGYFKRQDEIQDRANGLLDTAQALLPEGEGKIRRLLSSVQKTLSTVSLKRETDNDGDS